MASHVTKWKELGTSVRFLRRFVSVSPPSPVSPHVPSSLSNDAVWGAGLSQSGEIAVAAPPPLGVSPPPPEGTCWTRTFLLHTHPLSLLTLTCRNPLVAPVSSN